MLLYYIFFNSIFKIIYFYLLYFILILFYIFLRDFILKKTLFEKTSILKTRTIKSLKEEEKKRILCMIVSILYYNIICFYVYILKWLTFFYEWPGGNVLYLYDILLLWNLLLGENLANGSALTPQHVWDMLSPGFLSRQIIVNNNDK